MMSLLLKQFRNLLFVLSTFVFLALMINVLMYIWTQCSMGVHIEWWFILDFDDSNYSSFILTPQDGDLVSYSIP